MIPRLNRVDVLLLSIIRFSFNTALGYAMKKALSRSRLPQSRRIDGYLIDEERSICAKCGSRKFGVKTPYQGYATSVSICPVVKMVSLGRAAFRLEGRPLVSGEMVRFQRFQPITVLRTRSFAGPYR